MAPETVAQPKRRRTPSKRVPKPSVELVPGGTPEPTPDGVSDAPLPAETLAVTAPSSPRSSRSPKPRSPRKPRASATATTSEPYPLESPQPSILVSSTATTLANPETDAAHEAPARTRSRRTRSRPRVSAADRAPPWQKSEVRGQPRVLKAGSLRRTAAESP